MVTHSSGMPDVADYEWDKPQYDDGALERYVRSLDTSPLCAWHEIQLQQHGVRRARRPDRQGVLGVV
jgi:hypothetical protein